MLVCDGTVFRGVSGFRRVQLIPRRQQMANNCNGRAGVRGWSNAGVTVLYRQVAGSLTGSLLTRIPHAPGVRPGGGCGGGGVVLLRRKGGRW